MKTNFARYFDRSSLDQTERVISHRGVIFHGLSYASPLLNAVHQMDRTPDRTVIHFDRNDLSHIYIFEQRGPGFAAIPCSHFRYAKGLTLDEHRAVLTHCRRFSLTPNEDMLLRILWEIRTGACAPDSAGPSSYRSNSPKSKIPRRRQKDTDYTTLMAQLGSAVQNFGMGGNHV